MDALMYGNLISTFFVENKLIASRPERLKNSFEYVMTVKSYSSQKSYDSIRNKIENVDSTFMKKWRSSKYDGEEHFKQENENWCHKVLQVHIRNPFF